MSLNYNHSHQRAGNDKNQSGVSNLLHEWQNHIEWWQISHLSALPILRLAEPLQRLITQTPPVPNMAENIKLPQWNPIPPPHRERQSVSAERGGLVFDGTFHQRTADYAASLTALWQTGGAQYLPNPLGWSHSLSRHCTFYVRKPKKDKDKGRNI